MSSDNPQPGWNPADNSNPQTNGDPYGPPPNAHERRDDVPPPNDYSNSSQWGSAESQGYSSPQNNGYGQNSEYGQYQDPAYNNNVHQPNHYGSGSYPSYQSNQHQGSPNEAGKALSLVSLISGIVVFLLGLIPVVGIFLQFLGLLPIITGIIGWVTAAKVHNKRAVTFSIIGIALAVVGFIVSIIVTAAIVQDPSFQDGFRNSFCSDSTVAQQNPEICSSSNL